MWAPISSRRWSTTLLLLLLGCLLPRCVFAIVVTEIHYHPPGTGEASRRLEFIELFNEDPDPRDLTGFAFVEGVSFVFPERTILAGRSYLVVCADVDAIQQAYGIQNTVGNWSTVTALDNGGERITLLRRGGGVVLSLEYNDRGLWPAAPDESGHTLELRDPYEDIDDASNWSQSRDPGGTPGRANSPGPQRGVVFNEGLVHSETDRWVELYNRSGDVIDLSGLYLSDDPTRLSKSQLPPGTVIGGGDWLRLDESSLGLDFSIVPAVRDRVWVALYDSATSRVLDAFTFRPWSTGPESLGFSEARVPDGGDSVFPSADPTPGAENRVTVNEDIVVNEIHYHPIFDDPEREFIELTNKGDVAENLGGWQFDSGVNFVFPADTMLLPGNFLVVCRRPSLISEIYGLSEVDVLGPNQDDEALDAFGTLRNRGERVRLRDERGNVVDDLRYHDGGNWSRWADGGGSSLELIDPEHDNACAQAWDASDDSHRAEVVEYTYEGEHIGGPGNESEIHLYLLDDGISLVDDLFIEGGEETRVVAGDVFVDEGDVWEIFKGRRAPADSWNQLGDSDAFGAFLRGDCNSDGVVDAISDAQTLLLFNFGSTEEPLCFAACDANGDGDFRGDVSDAVFLLVWQFLAGNAPGAPFPDCGTSSTAADLNLGCENSRGCTPVEEGWFEGATPVGYGETSVETSVDDMRNSFTSLYFRRYFDFDDPDAVEGIFFRLDVDDGFVAYLNGTEIGRLGLNGSPPEHDATASFPRECCENSALTYDLTDKLSLFRPGRNLLAVQVHNRRVFDDDVFFAPELFTIGKVTLSDGRNAVPQGDFELSPGADWIIQGTHSRSARTTEDPIAGSGSLRLVASGAGDQKINRIEAELEADLEKGSQHRVTFKARWVVGTPTLGTMGYNFGMMKTHELAVPERLGSPGAPNGVARKLGPIIDEVSQEPVLPAPGEEVLVKARIRDPDGVASARLRYAVDSVHSDFGSVPMQVDGDFYVGTIPPCPINAVVVFEIEAEDEEGGFGRFPRDLREVTHPLVENPEFPSPEEMLWCVYGCRSYEEHPFHQYHMWMHLENENLLDKRGTHSDEYLDASCVFDNKKIYYNVGFRFQGSALGRLPWDKFRARFRDDRLLHGRFQRFNLDSDALDARDRLTHYILSNNVGDRSMPYSTHTYTQLRVNQRSGATRIQIMPPGKEYLRRWFPGDDREDLFEMTERSVFTDFGNSNSRVNCFFLHPPYPNLGSGTDKENYRFFFDHRTNKGRDLYEDIFSSSLLFDPTRTPDGQFDALVFDEIDVEEFLRVFAIRQNTADVDTWGGDYGRSAFFYRPAVADRLLLFPFDSDRTYGSVFSQFFPSSPTDPISNAFPEVRRFLNRPRVRRMYYAILHEMVETHFNSAYLAPFVKSLRDVGARNLEVGDPGGWIDRRVGFIRDWLEQATFPVQGLEITTNGGEAITLDEPSITLSGLAPAEVSSIQVVGIEAEEQPDVSFSNTDFFGWTLADIPLSSGDQTLQLVGMDRGGEIVDTASIPISVTD